MSKRAKKTEAPSGESMVLPLAGSLRSKDCAAQHFGKWCIEPKWFADAMRSVASGAWKPKALDDDAYDTCDSVDDAPLYTLVGRVAVICVDGQMTKKGSSFGGCSTVEVRKALRQAALDWSVDSIMLKISSPGGTVAGTSDLADDIVAVRTGTLAGMTVGKPVDCFAEDICCSAGYWLASQCGKITANKTAVIGSIGTYCVLADETGADEMLGIKYQVVSSGAYKGLGADGKMSDLLIADVQREIDEINKPFLAAVVSGRGKNVDITQVADGRAWVAEQAMNLGLIDGIGSLDEAIASVAGPALSNSKPTYRSSTMSLEQFKAYVEANPGVVAEYREQGRKAGVADAIARAKAVRDACAGDDALACDLIVAGKDHEDAVLMVNAKKRERDAAAAARKDAEEAVAKANKEADEKLAAANKEIERLKAEAGTQGAVRTAGSSKQRADDTEEPEDEPNTNDPKAHKEWAQKSAAHEWDTNPELHKGFSKKENYVAWRSAELAGKARHIKGNGGAATEPK